MPVSREQGSSRSALDPARVDDLRVFTSDELEAIVAEVVRNISAAIAGTHSAAVTGDMSGLARAAHAGRNEALLVGAQEVAHDFERMELAARAGDAHAAQAATQRVRASWATTRSAIEQLPRCCGST